jgi:hypothetical protein
MSIQKRWRVIVAALTQQGHEFQCECGNTALIIGHHPPDFTGLLCHTCEQKHLDQWFAGYQARIEQQTKRGIA